jgi:hypothetical protein
MSEDTTIVQIYSRKSEFAFIELMLYFYAFQENLPILLLLGTQI